MRSRAEVGSRAMSMLAVAVAAVLLVAVSHPERALAQRSKLIFEHPFIIAARTGDIDHVRELLAQGENPEIRDRRGQTPLMITIVAGFTEMSEMLIGASRNLDMKDNQGNTALSWSVIQDQFALTQILLEAGADPNIANRQGLTPVMLAAKDNRPDHLEILLTRSPDLNLRDYTGRSALGWARHGRDPSVARMLERAGARD